MKNQGFIPFLTLLIILISGCAGDQKNKINQTLNTPSPVLTAPATADFAPIKEEVVSSANQLQSNLTGLVNTSIGKLAEKLVGLETQFESLVKIQAQMNNTATINNTATLKAMAEFKADIQTSIALETKINNVMEAIIDTKVTIGQIKAQVETFAQVQAQAQAGLINTITTKIDTVKNDLNAGRDVNYLPKEAVNIIQDTNASWLKIFLTAISAVVSVAGLLVFNSRKREAATNALLMQALAHVPPEKAREFLPPALKR